MLHYLHHMFFDPVSAWEKMKFDLLIFLALFGFLFTCYLILYLFKQWKKRS